MQLSKAYNDKETMANGVSHFISKIMLKAFSLNKSNLAKTPN